VGYSGEDFLIGGNTIEVLMFKERYGNEINRLLRGLGAWRINRDSIDFKWGYFAPRIGLEIMLHQGGYFDSRYAISWCFGWGQFHVKLPFKTKIPESCDTPRYGIQVHNDTFWLHLGGKMNSWEQCDSKWITWYLPFFHWVHDFHQFKDSNGNWIDGGWENRDNAYIEEHPYTYTLKSGEIQERVANCCVERRQWHRKWFPFLKMVRTTIDIQFNDEVGERSGSWKGGCVGCGWELLEGETIDQGLKRMEKEREFN